MGDSTRMQLSAILRRIANHGKHIANTGKNLARMGCNHSKLEHENLYRPMVFAEHLLPITIGCQITEVSGENTTVHRRARNEPMHSLPYLIQKV